MEKLTENLKKNLLSKTGMAAGAAALLISVAVVFLLWSQGPEYQLLYSGLSPEDSGAVIDVLRGKKIPYKVDGSTISIPADQVYETRMELAGEGLPQGGGVGLEIFDKTGFGVTEFVQKVNYRRAQQGELARTISQLKEIESARVHLALPDKGIFVADKKKATASIVVKLRGSSSLTQGQVQAIVHLVANSFEDLTPENIAVVDTTGRMWTKGSEQDSAIALSSTQLEFKRSMEKDLEARVQSMLEKAVGADRAVVRVSAEIDSTHVERTEEKFDPDSQVVRSEQRNKEKTIGGTVPSGVPGVGSNLPDSTGAKNSARQTQRQDEVINYEINKVVSRVVEPVGDLKRLTVSVMVDGSYQPVTSTDGTESKKYVERTPEELAKFTEMVKAAVGFSKDRGDVITVVSSPFETVSTPLAAAPESEPMIPVALIPVIIKYVTASIIALLAMLLVVRPLLRRLLDEKTGYDKMQRALVEAEAGAGQALTEGSPPIQLKENPINRIKELAKENPQHVAMVLKTWIKEK